MRRALLLASAALVLAACDGGQVGTAGGEASADASVDMEMIAPASPEMARAGGSGGADAAAPAAQVPEAQVPQLAYAYAYDLETPTANVAALAARHERACVQAGPARCQVIGSRSGRVGEDMAEATLELRAEPGWLTAFRNGLAGDVEQAGGRIVTSSTSTEDLTRARIDTEAHLAAKTALRDRLQTMLATRTGDLQSALEVERELARVQGEIDAARSTLEVMRARVSMSRITLTYRSEGVLAPDTATNPLSVALENALTVFMTALAAIVTILAFALPFALVIVPVVWWILRSRRRAAERRRAERAAAQAAAAEPDAN